MSSSRSSSDISDSEEETCSCYPPPLCPNHIDHQHQVKSFRGKPIAFLEAMKKKQVKAVQVTITTSHECCDWDGVCSLNFLTYFEKSKLVRVKDAQGNEFTIPLNAVLSYSDE